MIIMLLIGPLAIFSTLLSFVGTVQTALDIYFDLQISVIDVNGTETGKM